MTPRRRATDVGWGGSTVHTIIALALLVLALTWCMQPAHADAQTAALAPARVSIPASSYLYRFRLQREVTARFGSQEPVARVAAQVHAESRWDPAARSSYAEGMAQFTPATSRWLESVCPEIGAPDPWDANWSVRAVVCYDAWLHARVGAAATACDAWAFTLSAYNGGLSWTTRDKRLAANAGADASRWFGAVEKYSARAGWARTENRSYVARILRDFEPAYLAAGWPGQAVCT